MAKQKSDSTPRDAMMDMVQELKKVFHRHSLYSRTDAWKRITSGKGEKLIKNLLQHPDYSTVQFRALTFKEWTETNHGTPRETPPGTPS